MVLVLVLGDLHIPLRTHDLPAKFKKLLVPGKIQQIICTGNICDRETWEYLRSIAPDVRGVRGDYDDNTALPPSLVVQHSPLRIGVLHGHQVVPLGDTESLSAVARKMDVHLLVSGATHKFEAFEYDTRFFINPGSATGAFTPHIPAPGSKANTEATTNEGDDNKENEGDGADQEAKVAKAEDQVVPSFALLDIQGTVVVTYVYQLVGGEVKVEKIEHRAKV